MESSPTTACWTLPALAPYLRGAADLTRVLSGPAWHHARVGVSDVTARLIEQACLSATEASAEQRPGSP